MNSFKDLAFSRRSIRKFDNTGIPVEDIEYLISTASSAPSGCNSQCWRFVAVKDKAVMEKMAEAVFRRVEAIVESAGDEIPGSYMASKRKMVSFFASAPVVIAVFMGRLDYYDPILEKALIKNGLSNDDIMKLFAYPDYMSVAAAVQNLLLAAHEKGYGACWMNEPALAGAEIASILSVPSDYKLVSLVPVGKPAYTPRDKKLKGLDEILRVIDNKAIE